MLFTGLCVLAKILLSTSTMTSVNYKEKLQINNYFLVKTDANLLLR